MVSHRRAQCLPGPWPCHSPPTHPGMAICDQLVTHSSLASKTGIGASPVRAPGQVRVFQPRSKARGQRAGPQPGAASGLGSFPRWQPWLWSCPRGPCSPSQPCSLPGTPEGGEGRREMRRRKRKKHRMEAQPRIRTEASQFLLLELLGIRVGALQLHGEGSCGQQTPGLSSTECCRGCPCSWLWLSGSYPRQPAWGFQGLALAAPVGWLSVPQPPQPPFPEASWSGVPGSGP